MRAVLMSIKPKWCELIASGKKTVEVRKTKPSIAPPFKVYIYCTRPPRGRANMYNAFGFGGYAIEYGGKVIGEFVCDRIGYVRNYGDAVDSYDCIASCLSAKEIIEYATDKNGNFVYTYGWHISDLVIYDKPRELGEFWAADKCPYASTDGCTYKYHCYRAGQTKRCGKIITRPPQSWCYVEEVNRDER